MQEIYLLIRCISIQSLADSPIRTDGNHINFTTREDAAQNLLIDQLKYLGDQDASGNRCHSPTGLLKLGSALGVVVTSNGYSVELGLTDLNTIKGLAFIGNPDVNTTISRQVLSVSPLTMVFHLHW